MTEANKEEFPAEEMPAIRKEMSRRQFLSYTLGGTGAFLMTLPLVVNLRFAVDPLLQERAGSEWVKVVEADKITETPQSFSFQKRVVDGWYESEPKMKPALLAMKMERFSRFLRSANIWGARLTGMAARTIRMNMFVLATARTTPRTERLGRCTKTARRIRSEG